MVLPLVKGFQVERGQAAHRGPVHAAMVEAGGQGDLAAQIGHLDLEAGQLLMLRQRPVYMVAEQNIGFAGFHPGGQNADPKTSGGNRPNDRAVLRAFQRPVLVVHHRPHEGVGQHRAMMQVERLAVGIAPGGTADLDKLLDFRVVDLHIDRRRSTSQRALADGQGQGIHDPDERHHAVPDGAEVAPIAADAAAPGGEPDVLGPDIDDSLKRIGGFIQETGNRQAAIGAAVGQHRGGGHEPQVGNIIIEALGMGGIVGEVRGHPGKEILEGFAGKQIAVGQGRLAEVGQLGIAPPVQVHRNSAFILKMVADFPMAQQIFQRQIDLPGRRAVRGRVAAWVAACAATRVALRRAVLRLPRRGARRPVRCVCPQTIHLLIHRRQTGRRLRFASQYRRSVHRYSPQSPGCGKNRPRGISTRYGGFHFVVR